MNGDPRGKKERCIAWVLEQEGGYKPSEPGDPETYRGLTRTANPDWPGWQLLDERQRRLPVARGEILPVLDDLVRDRYEHRYWTARLERASEPLALAMLDFLVNSGAAQRLLDDLEEKLNRSPTPEEVIQIRGHYMMDLACGFVSKNPAKIAYWTTVLPGWMKRLRANLFAVRAMKEK